MSFEENLIVEIESVFRDQGFEKLDNSLKSASAKLQAMDQLMRQSRGMNQMRQRASEFSDKMDEAGISFQSVDSGSVADVSSTLREAGGGAIRFSDSFKELASEGTSAYQEAISSASKQVDEFGGVLTDNNGKLLSRLDVMRRLRRVHADGPVFSPGGDSNLANRLDEFEGGSEMRRRLARGDDSAMPTTSRMSRAAGGATRAVSGLRGAFRRAGIASMTFGSGMSGVLGTIKDAAPATRTLQMRLLGLQFTMMTVAFLFGGVMASALGAVGVFKVLGNTLRFLFLPTALDVLDNVLELQRMVMGMDTETRKLIGTVFGWISAFSLAATIAAVLGKAILTLIGPITTLVSFLGGPITLLLALAAVLGLIAFRGSQATEQGSKLNSFLKKAGELASNLFEYTAKVGKRIATFLGKVFFEMMNWFKNADWERIWGNFFDFANNAKAQFKQFLDDAVTRAVTYYENEDWDKVWDSFFDFSKYGLRGLRQFLSDTINEIVDWAANDADWMKIWDEMFKVEQDLKVAAAELAGLVAGNIIKFFQQINWGDVLGAIINPSKALTDVKKERFLSGKIGQEKLEIGKAFMEGFNSVEGPQIEGTTDRIPQGARLQNQDNTYNITINGKNQTSREDGREVTETIRELEAESTTGNTTAGQ